MSRDQLYALINGLIAFCQREGVLPTNTGDLADELQSIAADECYISKMDLIDFIEG